MDDSFMLEGKTVLNARLTDLLTSLGILSIFVEDDHATCGSSGSSRRNEVLDSFIGLTEKLRTISISSGCAAFSATGLPAIRRRVQGMEGHMLRWMVIALVLMAEPAFAEECQSPWEPVSGRLGLFETRHPNGDPVKGWVLFTNDMCVHMENSDGDMVDMEPRVVHVVFADSKEPPDLMELSVDTVTAKGELMEAHTIWHLGDVVMLNAEIVPETGP